MIKVTGHLLPNYGAPTWDDNGRTFAHRMVAMFSEMLARDAIGVSYPGLSDKGRSEARRKRLEWQQAADWNDALDLPWDSLARGTHPVVGPLD